jgi:aryl-phospho-beta-D-glucosidase BglC (GH1 family)
MEMNKRKLLLLLAIVMLNLTVTLGVLAYDRYSAGWSNYGPMGTKCLAGVAANVQNNQLVNVQHWAGMETPCPQLGAWVEKTQFHNSTYAWTHGYVKYPPGTIDSEKFVSIHV